MLMAAWSGADCALAIVAVARHHMQAAATRLRNSEPRVIVRTVSNSSAVPFSRTPARFYRSRANALTGWLHRGGNRNPLNSLARSFASSDGARLASVVVVFRSISIAALCAIACSLWRSCSYASLASATRGGAGRGVDQCHGNRIQTEGLGARGGRTCDLRESRRSTSLRRVESVDDACRLPPINDVGALVPGQSKSTGTLTEAKISGYHDPSSEGSGQILMGTITVR